MDPCVVAFSQLLWLPVRDEKPRQQRVVPGQIPWQHSRISFVFFAMFFFFFLFSFLCQLLEQDCETQTAFYWNAINHLSWEQHINVSGGCTLIAAAENLTLTFPILFLFLYVFRNIRHHYLLSSVIYDPLFSIPPRLTCLLCPTPNVVPGHRTVASNNNAHETRGLCARCYRAHKHERITQHPN